MAVLTVTSSSQPYGNTIIELASRLRGAQATSAEPLARLSSYLTLITLNVGTYDSVGFLGFLGLGEYLAE